MKRSYKEISKSKRNSRSKSKEKGTKRPVGRPRKDIKDHDPEDDFENTPPK